jgi:myo-inositol-1(or 4)-monophosphatase
MENFSWFNLFREMGARVKAETSELVKGHGAGSPVGKGASGDTTLAVDKRAEDAILSVLEEASADGEEFTFISEELGERSFGGGNTIILADPIDGSNNAKYGLPFYSTSIALATGRRLSDVVLGYVMNLATGEEFWAIKGGGAFRDGIPVRTSNASEIGMLNFECTKPERDLERAAPLLRSSRKIRCLGSIALDLAILSCGMTDVVLVPSPSRSFDFAAGWLMVNEAGGVVTDTDGKPVSETALGVKRSCTLVAAANQGLLDRALASLGGK